jgi:hypothetical protein
MAALEGMCSRGIVHGWNTTPSPVARHEDTRPPTDAEMALALSETSKLGPLTSSAAGLWIRLYTRAFPAQAKGLLAEIDRTVTDYERLLLTQMGGISAGV